jgi:hypothetical protein
MSARYARGAICALAVTLAVPAFAKHDKSLDDCTSFTQTEKGDDTLELTVQNSCKIPIDCSVTWRVVCAPQSAKRKSVHAQTKKFALTEGAGQTEQASASVCGDDDWAIDSIKWGCEPNKD